MKIFIDTNVLLDVLIEREPFYKDSAIVWTMVEKNLVKASRGISPRFQLIIFIIFPKK
jgi:hypothetical protein